MSHKRSSGPISRLRFKSSLRPSLGLRKLTPSSGRCGRARLGFVFKPLGDFSGSSQNLLGPLGSVLGPKSTQKDPKSELKESEEGPKRIQESPKSSQEAAKRLSTGSKRLPRGSKSLPRGPNWLPDSFSLVVHPLLFFAFPFPICANVRSLFLLTLSS